jgi:hypothetical protein
MMAITTKSSIKVNAVCVHRRTFQVSLGMTLPPEVRWDETVRLVAASGGMPSGKADLPFYNSGQASSTINSENRGPPGGLHAGDSLASPSAAP